MFRVSINKFADCAVWFNGCFIRWDPKKRMTPEEAVHHDWLQPGNSSSTFIITSSTSASSLMKHSRDPLKENDQTQQQLMQKYQRSQPITPLTILPQIKTPSNRVSQRYNNTNTISGTKDISRVKGKPIETFDFPKALSLINKFCSSRFSFGFICY